jgi:hypothetical protein
MSNKAELHIGPLKTVISPDDIKVKNCRQTGNAAGALGVMRGIGLAENARWDPRGGERGDFRFEI